MRAAISGGCGEASCPHYHNLSKPYITGMPLPSTTLTMHPTLSCLFGTSTRQYNLFLKPIKLKKESKKKCYFIYTKLIHNFCYCPSLTIWLKDNSSNPGQTGRWWDENNMSWIWLLSCRAHIGLPQTHTSLGYQQLPHNINRDTCQNEQKKLYKW